MKNQDSTLIEVKKRIAWPFTLPERKKIDTTKDFYPKRWKNYFDETIPLWVKKTYPPRGRNNTKEFTSNDFKFYLSGIIELSEHFTTDRAFSLHEKRKGYFSHKKFRASYILYLLQVHAASFFSLFELHKSYFEEKIKTKKTITILDYGCGPGTASIAFLFFLKKHYAKQKISLEFNWVDSDPKIMKDGKELIDFLKSENHSISIKTWIPEKPMNTMTTNDLIFLGNVLNESRKLNQKITKKIASEVRKNPKLLILAVEPAAKDSAQNLALFRDYLIQEQNLFILAPCLHQEACPLSNGKDWCHFSLPTFIPSALLNGIKKSLEIQNRFQRFSYFIAGSPQKNSSKKIDEWRVLSDPLSSSQNKKNKTHSLLCAPETTKRVTLSQKQKFFRGDIIICSNKSTR